MISLLLILSACFYDETEDNTLYTAFLFSPDLQTGLDYYRVPCGVYDGQFAFCGNGEICESEALRLCRVDYFAGCVNDSAPSWYSPHPHSDEYPAACPDYEGSCRMFDLCSRHEERCIRSNSTCAEY